MLVFEKVEGIIANCSNSYHFVIREIPLDGPEFHMLALELNGAAHFHGWIPSTHIRGPPTHAARWRRRPNARKHSFSGGINLIAPNPSVNHHQCFGLKRLLQLISRSMTCRASSIISCTIWPAGLMSFTSPALSPAIRHISSKSPVVSGMGGRAENLGKGTCWPPSTVCPMTWVGSAL